MLARDAWRLANTNLASHISSTQAWDTYVLFEL